jgi:hypothetical protein
VEDDPRPDQPSQSDLSEVVLAFLDMQPHFSSRAILHELGMTFHAPRLIPHGLSEAQRNVERFNGEDE